MKRILPALTIFACAAVARAQTTSDLMPPLPPAPPGTAQPWYPGGPLPPAPSPQQRPPGEEPAAPATGRNGYIINDDASALGESESLLDSPSPSDRSPDEYVVKRGDTLWDLSATYLKSPWYWPRLWSYNPTVTNPHWIYPGDVLRLHPPDGVAPLPRSKRAAEPGPRRFTSARVMPPAGVFLRQTGFLEPGELAAAGIVIGSKEEKIMLSTLDEAYVEFQAGHPLHIGERYTVYQPMREVKHPVTGERLGEVVEIFGEVLVKAVTDGHIARVLIVDSTDSIERGFRVGALRRQFKRVEPKIDETDRAGVIVETLRSSDLVDAETIAFLDLGRLDGLEVGNRVFAVRRGDGYQPLLATRAVDNPRFPRENIAEILVVDLRDHLATGVVLRSVKEAQVGDRIEAHKGF